MEHISGPIKRIMDEMTKGWRSKDGNWESFPGYSQRLGAGEPWTVIRHVHGLALWDTKFEAIAYQVKMEVDEDGKGTWECQYESYEYEVDRWLAACSSSGGKAIQLTEIDGRHYAVFIYPESV